jgi:cyanocobalamin reductase (cyanide-eliminating) / alkylcobalamin dealkylase
VRYAGPVTGSEWAAVAEQIAAACADAGLDLTCAFNVRAYNLQAAQNEKLFDFGRPDALGVLIGNTRRLWPVFKRAFEAEPALQGDPNPLDAYVTGTLRKLGARLGPPCQLLFAHATAPKAFPFQRLADAVGFATVSPSHLAIHAEHGPWIALRAVLLVDVEGPPPTLSRPLSPCRGCRAPCVPALEHALSVTAEPLSEASIAERADDWIAVRDACPVGRGSRYGSEQLTYHYTKRPLSAPSDPPGLS